MSKHDNESHINYRKRVMDDISPTFCAAKWLNATLWLANGKTASCHHPLAHQSSSQDVLASPQALHNTKKKIQDRLAMLTGKKPSDCEYCWKLESLGKDIVSDRIFKTIIYPDSIIQELALEEKSRTPIPKTLEIAFDRNCNLACIYCNPCFSTRWKSDIDKMGPYTQLIHHEGNAYKNDGTHENPFEGKENPYLQSFWKWWPELKNNLSELRITGGEPLLSHDFWKLCEDLSNNPPTNCIIGINSNLTVNRLEELINLFRDKLTINLYTSCEATGKQAEYIRHGLKYDEFIDNLEMCCKSGAFQNINMMLTINVLSIFSISDFLDQMLILKKRYGRFYPVLTFNILRFPSFLNVSVLPKTIKNEIAKQIDQWLLKNRDDITIHQIEIDGVQRLTGYLHNIEQSHAKAADRNTMKKDLKSFLNQYDSRRNLDYKNIFPIEFIDWLTN